MLKVFTFQWTNINNYGTSVPQIIYYGLVRNYAEFEAINVSNVDLLNTIVRIQDFPNKKAKCNIVKNNL